MPLQAVCFDLFNTLVNVGHVPPEYGRFTADVLGIPREAWNSLCFSEHHEICAPTRHLDVIRELAHRFDPNIPMQRIENATNERQSRFDHALQSVPATTLEMIGELRQRGIKIALISNASTAEVRAWPDSSISELFDVAVFSCECGYCKPDIQIYQYTLAKLDLDAGDVLFIGDGGSMEHLGAYNAGIRSLLLTEHLTVQHHARVREQQQAYYMREINDIRDLPRILEILEQTER